MNNKRKQSNIKVRVITNYYPPEEVGTHYRLLCLTGKNKGTCYYIRDNRIVLGRGEDIDINVDDVKCSREHAELVFIDKKYVISDLGSQNGIIVNDLKIKQHHLVDGDNIIIGRTVYKYGIVEVEAEVLYEDEDEEIKMVDGGEEQLALPPVDEDKQKRLKRLRLIIGVLAIGLVFLFLDDEPPKKSRVIASYARKKASPLDATLKKMIEERLETESHDSIVRFETAIHNGLRELREKNYFRAMGYFQLAKVLKGGNRRADVYFERAKEDMHEEIDQIFLRGKQAEEAIKFKEAIVSYCSIKRYLTNYPEDENYIEADTKLKNLQSLAGLKNNEIKCFTKE